MCVRDFMMGNVVFRGKVVVVVFLDIVNVFNFLFWSCILEVFWYYWVFIYFCCVIEVYLMDRFVIYVGY